MATLVMCLEFAAEHLTIHGGIGCPVELQEPSGLLCMDGRWESIRAADVVPGIVICFRDFPPVVIPAASGEAFPEDDRHGQVNFCGRGKAILFEFSSEDVRSWAIRAPLWVIIVLHMSRNSCASMPASLIPGDPPPEQAASKHCLILASACLDLGGHVARAAATGPMASLAPYTRAALDLMATSGSEKAATLDYAIRLSCVRDGMPTSDGAQRMFTDLPLSIEAPITDSFASRAASRQGVVTEEKDCVTLPVIAVRGSSPLRSTPRSGSPHVIPRPMYTHEVGEGVYFPDQVLVRPALTSSRSSSGSDAYSQNWDDNLQSPYSPVHHVVGNVAYSPRASPAGMSVGSVRSLGASPAGLDARLADDLRDFSNEPSALPLVLEMTRELLETPTSTAN